ncbi:MAG TPA: hypothetical protein DCZ95_09415 [Verrucomicrobia bacterium]|nr:MAG: hypothetical protein A2X46_06320 [Lentisphaerae bacterium GWF2_57_35]HBA84297.1 hypothetical protein [Verrucomicrobiota bacterium]
MKRLIILAVLLSASVSYGYYGWGIYMSYWSPKDADGEFGPGAKLTIEMVPSVQLELRGTYYNEFSASGDSDVDIRVVPLEAGLALTLPVAEVHRLYAGGGFSYFLVDTKVGPNVDDEAGGYLVAGADFQVTDNAALFAEGKYTIVQLEHDIDMNGLGANAGLLVTW